MIQLSVTIFTSFFKKGSNCYVKKGVSIFLDTTWSHMVMKNIFPIHEKSHVVKQQTTFRDASKVFSVSSTMYFKVCLMKVVVKYMTLDNFKINFYSLKAQLRVTVRL